MMYSISSYVAMAINDVRVDAYARALQRVVHPESFVVEIGTGRGAFAVMARQLGARRVVAIESGDAIAVARRVARENGAADIEFIQAHSQDVTLSERADVIVSDLRGMLPLYADRLRSIIDARERFLAPAGRLIPVADTLYAAVVQLSYADRRRFPPHAPVRAVVVDPARFVTGTWDSMRFRPDQVVSRSEPWATIDYRTIAQTDICGHASLEMLRDAPGDGLAIWFDANLLDGIGFSNSPRGPELVYSTAFFPWPDRVMLRRGDKVKIRIDARQVAGDYVWQWQTTFDALPPALPAFQQTKFYAVPWTSAKLARGLASHVPILSEDGEVERYILDAMDGATSSAEIAHRVVERFPRQFPHSSVALGRVGNIARRVCRLES